MLGGGLIAVALNTGLVSSSARPYTLQIDGLEVSRAGATLGTMYGVDPESITITERLGSPWAMSFRVDDPGKQLSIRKRANVYMADHRGRIDSGGSYVSDDLFRGIVLSRVRQLEGLGWVWDVRAISLEALLDRQRLDAGVLPAGMRLTAAMQSVAQTLDPRISALDGDPNAQSVSRQAAPNLLIDGSSTLPEAIPLKGKTYRQALEAISAAWQGTYGAGEGDEVIDVDAQGRLRWRPLTAALPIRDPREGSLVPVGQPAMFAIEPDEDSASVVHRVYVQGATDAVSGWVQTADPVTDGDDLIEDWLDRPEVTTVAARDAAGRSYLSQHGRRQRLGFRLRDTHDELLEAPGDNQGSGWHVRSAFITVQSGSGLFDNIANPIDNNLWQLERTFPGASEVELQLYLGGLGRDPGAAIASRIATARDESKAAPRLWGTLRRAQFRRTSGPPTDADVDVPVDGMFAIDESGAGGGTLYARISGQWVAIGGVTFSTFTPAVAGGGTATFSTQTGWYFRMGKVVFLCIFLVVNAAGSGAAGVTIETPTAPDRSTRQVLNGYTSALGAQGAASMVAFTGGAGVVWDRIAFPAAGANDDDTTLTGAGLLAGGILTFMGMYREA